MLIHNHILEINVLLDSLFFRTLSKASIVPCILLFIVFNLHYHLKSVSFRITWDSDWPFLKRSDNLVAYIAAPLLWHFEIVVGNMVVKISWVGMTQTYLGHPLSCLPGQFLYFGALNAPVSFFFSLLGNIVGSSYGHFILILEDQNHFSYMKIASNLYLT